MCEEKSWLDRTSNERTDMLISNTLIDTIEGLIHQIAQAWSVPHLKSDKKSP